MVVKNRRSSLLVTGLLTFGACGKSSNNAPPPAPPVSTGPAVPLELEPQIATMRKDLSDMVTREEAFFADSLRYSRSLSRIGFHASDGVTVTVDRLGNESWRATATHKNAPGWTCGVYIGTDVAPFQPDMKEGLPRCWKGQ